MKMAANSMRIISTIRFQRAGFWHLKLYNLNIRAPVRLGYNEKEVIIHGETLGGP